MNQYTVRVLRISISTFIIAIPRLFENHLKEIGKRRELDLDLNRQFIQFTKISVRGKYTQMFPAVVWKSKCFSDFLGIQYAAQLKEQVELLKMG